jgi:hypothetical protein
MTLYTGCGTKSLLGRLKGRLNFTRLISFHIFDFFNKKESISIYHGSLFELSLTTCFIQNFNEIIIYYVFYYDLFYR